MKRTIHALLFSSLLVVTAAPLLADSNPTGSSMPMNPMMHDQKGMGMMHGGGMAMDPEAMKKRQSMMQQHMAAMERHMAKIESLLQELVALQKRK